MLERAAIDGAPEDRCGFHCSLGELLREQLSDSEASERAFQAALARMPDSARALAGLEGLARDSGDEAALTSALEGAVKYLRSTHDHKSNCVCKTCHWLREARHFRRSQLKST